MGVWPAVSVVAPRTRLSMSLTCTHRPRTSGLTPSTSRTATSVRDTSFATRLSQNEINLKCQLIHNFELNMEYIVMQ